MDKLFLLVTLMIIICCVRKVWTGDSGKCPKRYTETFETNCTSCHINVFVDCPDGSVKLTYQNGTEGCQYKPHWILDEMLDGCTHTCERNISIPECCKGFWGSNCDGRLSLDKVCLSNIFCVIKIEESLKCNCRVLTLF